MNSSTCLRPRTFPYGPIHGGTNQACPIQGDWKLFVKMKQLSGTMNLTTWARSAATMIRGGLCQHDRIEPAHRSGAIFPGGSSRLARLHAARNSA